MISRKRARREPADDGQHRRPAPMQAALFAPDGEDSSYEEMT
jgi:hypothetical protein